MDQKTILITGGCGFLGQNLVRNLSAHYKVVIVDIKVSPQLPGSDKITSYNSNHIPLDHILEKENVDTIIHTATLFGRNKESIDVLLNSNILFGVTLLEAAIKHNVKTFINTDTVLERKTSIYSLSKKQFLDWAKVISKDKVKFINVRLEHIYGMGASSTNFITDMIMRMKNNEPKIDLTAGEQLRDFIFIEDAVSAFESIIKTMNTFDSYEDFIISSGRYVKIKDIVLLIKKLTKSSTQLNFGAIPYREGELMQPIMPEQTDSKLNWSPKIPIEKGLNLMIN